SGRLKVASQPGDDRLSRSGSRRMRLCVGRFVAEILHCRGGRGGYLPAGGTNQRMGHGGGPRCAPRGGWSRRRPGRVAASIREARLSQPCLRCNLGLEAVAPRCVPGGFCRRGGPAPGRLIPLPGGVLRPWREVHPIRTIFPLRCSELAEAERLSLEP